MWKMKRLPVFWSLNRFGAFSKRLSSSSSSIDFDAHKSNHRLFQVFRNPSFSHGVKFGVSVVAGAAIMSVLSDSKPRSAQLELEQLILDNLKFIKWMPKHRRVYLDSNEQQKRFLIFQETLRSSSPLDMFADLTLDEKDAKISISARFLPTPAPTAVPVISHPSIYPDNN